MAGIEPVTLRGPSQARRLRIEKMKAGIRAKGEHPFRVRKRQFGFTQVRYRGLKKNTAEIVSSSACAALNSARYTATRRLRCIKLPSFSEPCLMPIRAGLPSKVPDDNSEWSRRSSSNRNFSRMNLLLIDDHPLFGLGFVQALSHGRAGVDVRTVLALDQGLELAGRWAALDAVLIDYRLGGDDGVDGLRRFGAQYPLVARVLISGDEDRVLVARARAAGAAAFLGKSMAMRDLIAALDVVCRGGEFFATRAEPVAAADGLGPTPRQLEVLALVASGRQNKQIAGELGIAERTVKLHVTALLSATGARNRTHLLVRARELGLL